ncbi:Cell division cycle protein 16 [Liparis tanakae]|uniref:Cell division cycle protein 16 n=1 Tax=Liparis tanakae TaxID=230148 RepID=A0A4Z2FMQ0_9TELE|nr:Cell division cycle protein 16 [Liparis tanakae]
MLAEKIAHITRTGGGVDNRNYYDRKSLGEKKRQLELLRITQENQRILFRLSQCRSHYNPRGWRESWLQTLKVMDSIAHYPRDRTSQQKQQYQSALFWADKIASLSREDPQDIYWLAQCLYLTSQYHRASHALRSRKLDKLYGACQYLAARCHYAAKEFQQALDILDSEEPMMKKLLDRSGKEDIGSPESAKDWDMSPTAVNSSICLLRGKIYDAMDNRPLATSSYKEALKLDVYCFEAFDLLTSHHMLTAQEEKDFLDSLPLSQQCTEEEEELLHFLFENKLKKYNKPSDLVVPEMVNGLHDNLDVVVSLAERHYYNCDFKMCYKLTSTVMVKDPFHANCLPVHIGTLVELGKANELFYLSHKLVDLYPNNPVSWFAVGCYYLMVGHKNEHARRYLRCALARSEGGASPSEAPERPGRGLGACLTISCVSRSKATTLERTYGPAWIAYGHSFAVESEHDQAMAAYFTAAQLMKGWKTAEGLFLDAMEKIKAIGNEVTVDKWEPLLNNLGHHASTYSSIGYVHSLMGDFESAIDYFHTALGLKRDDTFSVTMLGHCIEMYIGDTDAYIGTDISDKARGGSLNTPALIKMLNTSEPGDPPATPRPEEGGVASSETPPSNQDKMMLETPLRLSLTLECDMYESDVMLDTLSDAST